LKRLHQNLAECYQHLQPIEPLRTDYGLLQAVLDPYVNALHVSLLRQRRGSHAVRSYFVELRKKLLADGPSELGHREKMALLLDPESMIWLHEQLWKQPSEQLAEPDLALLDPRLELIVRYQLQGNAGGKILRCEPPRLLALSWVFGENPTESDVSEVEVRLAADPGYVDAVLVDGADRARAIAAETMQATKDVVGFIRKP